MPENYIKTIKMTDSITHASDTFFSFSLCIAEPLDSVFRSVFKVILLMNVHGCNYLAFYKLKENFPFSPSDYRDPGGSS